MNKKNEKKKQSEKLFIKIPENFQSRSQSEKEAFVDELMAQMMRQARDYSDGEETP